jgi:ureidoglycolate lyase
MQVTVECLTSQAFSPYGEVLGEPFADSAADDVFSVPATDFWHSADFSPGQGGQAEVLWVNYRNTSLTVDTLEVHWMTEQAIVPLNGATLVHVVCLGQRGEQQPDLSSLRAFRVPSGLGVKMKPGCWHTSFVAGGDEVTCLMLTRQSTTRELIGHLRHQLPATETTVVRIDPIGIGMPPDQG